MTFAVRVTTKRFRRRAVSWKRQRGFSNLISIVAIVVPVLFGIVGLAILTWLAVVATELVKTNPRVQRMLAAVISPAPGRPDVDKSMLPVKVVVEGVIPLVFWLLIFLPMIIFPIILIAFPLLGIPWTYLLPPVP